jgi:hypothetical protein
MIAGQSNGPESVTAKMVVVAKFPAGPLRCRADVVGQIWLLWVACSVDSRPGRSNKLDSQPLAVARSETIMLERGRTLSGEGLVSYVLFLRQGNGVRHRVRRMPTAAQQCHA